MLRESQVQALCFILHLGIDSTVKTLHMPMTSATKLLCLSLSYPYSNTVVSNTRDCDSSSRLLGTQTGIRNAGQEALQQLRTTTKGTP